MLKKIGINKRLILLIKIVVTITLCTIIIWKGNWTDIWKGLQASNLFFIVIVFLCMILGVMISTYKWQILLSIHGIHFDFGMLQRYYFTSVFFNNFLPTTIGGDSYRIYKTLENTHSRAGAVVAVFTERATGIWALLVLGFAGGIALFLQKNTDIPWLGIVLGTFGVLIVIPFIFVIFSKSVVPWVSARKNFPRILKKALEHFDDYRRQPGRTFQIILISIFYHLFALSWMVVLLKAIGATTSIYNLVVAVAISNLVAILPISINGIGLMDGSFIYVMGELGMNYEPALIFMLLVRTLLIPLSLIGGLFYLSDKKSIKTGDLRKKSIESIEESLS